MRVISGIYKGKEILGYHLNGTRPTMDRVKESLFAMIQDNIKNKTVLDLFAGSGSLGIEALSMEAKHCYFVDHSKEAIKVLETNMHKLNINHASIIKNDFISALTYFKEQNITFDLIFLDPPYNKPYLDIAIKKITELSLLNKGGLIICESDQNNQNNYLFLELIKQRKYGSKYIFIYKN